MSLVFYSLDLSSRSVVQTPLPLDHPESSCVVTLRALPGASAVHLLVVGGVGELLMQAEVECDPAEPATVRISRGSGNEVLATSSRRLLYIPPEDRYRPAVPLFTGPGAKLDVLFLFDGTARALAPSPSPVPGHDADAKAETADHGIGWPEHIEHVLQFAEELRREYRDTRLGCVAFGDHPLGDLAWAPDLTCTYALHPKDVGGWRMDAYSRDQLRDQIRRIEYTSGADFVDALAEALERCAEVVWRADARKLLVISGDSPGYSVLKPPPKGADARVRKVDVDLEAVQLHNMGVEIMTVYLGPVLPQGHERRFVDYAREQYEALASLRIYAWTGTGFDPGQAVAAVKSVDGAIARRSCYGIVERISV